MDEWGEMLVVSAIVAVGIVCAVLVLRGPRTKWEAVITTGLAAVVGFSSGWLEGGWWPALGVGALATALVGAYLWTTLDGDDTP